MPITTVPDKNRQIAKRQATPPPQEGRPWRPQMAIEAEALLIWAYRDQLVSRSGGGQAAAWSATAKALSVLRAGAIVTGGGQRFACHDAALMVDDIVQWLGSGDLLVAYASTGSRPCGWQHRARPWYPLHGDAGALRLPDWQALADYGPAVALPAKGRPSRQPVDVTPVGRSQTPDSLLAAKQRYVAWWQALHAFWEQAQLLRWPDSGDHRAPAFLVLPPKAPVEPWNQPAQTLFAGS